MPATKIHPACTIREDGMLLPQWLDKKKTNKKTKTKKQTNKKQPKKKKKNHPKQTNKKVTHAKISPKMVNPRDRLGNTEDGNGINGQIDRQAQQTSPVVYNLRRGGAGERAEVLRSLRIVLNKDRSDHHSTDRLKERGVEKAFGRRAIVQGRELPVFNQAEVENYPCSTRPR